MAWTSKQQEVIDNRDSSVLVSAAAGSGKTAVLVERILTKVLDKENPKDIDQFLVVTFTKAAAAQMRDKIAGRLEKELLLQPENEHLAKQLVLVNRADITTIDSFCLKLVKEHFSLLNIDSTMNIGDNGMMELLKSDVLDEMFEEKYKDEDFFALVDIFCGDKEDTSLKELILKIHRVASSYPMPEEWLQGAKKALAISEEEEFEKLPWVETFIDMAKNKLKDALIYVKNAKDICTMAGGPDKNFEIACQDEELICSMLDASGYRGMSLAMESKFPRLKTCKGDAYDEELVEEFKNVRESYKEIVKSVNVFKLPIEDVISQMNNLATYLIPLIEMVEEFMKKYEVVKHTKKLMEFSDVEHLAYKLCCDGYDESRNAIPSKIGKKIGERYEEIYIDEYQDSNYLQEDILTACSGIWEGRYNMFMVGDVKQSIYRFRMARPDLFMDKYERFLHEGDEVKIELMNNFRSRDVVLEAVNYFFYQLMGKDLGGIAYNKDIALVPSKEFPIPDSSISDRISRSTEILFVDASKEDVGDAELTDEELNLEKLDLEAKLVAKRILELTHPDTGQYIYDEDLDEYRLAQYRDIVILSRSIKGFGDTFYNVLSDFGIPVYLEDSKGYFDATEVKVIMSLLSVVDNRRQDIPFASVLLSPIGNMSENDVAVVCDYAYKNIDKKACLFDKCELYAEEFEDDIARRLRRILDIIGELKAMKKNTSISELIWKALDMTGYYVYASAMPMGNKRKANINMLIEKARKYEDGYYKGLFNFLRYIEKIKVNDVDFGEANILSDEDDVVRIISMHKSKGLEYPIVFASGLGKQFNNMDVRDSLIIHSDYFLSAMDINNEKRIKKNTFVRECFKQLIKQENMAEELRVLYVAMTRAKEKLILTGCDKEIDLLIEKSNAVKGVEGNLLPYSIRSSSSSFMKLIIMAMARYDILKSLLLPESLRDSICMRIFSYEEVLLGEVKTSIKKSMKIEDIKAEAELVSKDGYYEDILSNFNFTYPYKALTDIKSKMSISEIKKMKAFDGATYDVDEDLLASEDDRVKEECLPKESMSSSTGLNGAQRGTIVHKFMELIPFDTVLDNMEELKELRSRFVEEDIFSLEEADAINLYKIRNMLKSDLGLRMRAAAKNKTLYKEQQFSAGIKASSIYNELEGVHADDVVVVQGIIDAFFYEGEDIVVMDYKTDRASKEELIGRYKAQLDYYADILSSLTGKVVKEKIIYSFYLESEIQL